MREPALGREGEFHSDSKCKLVVKDGGRREKEGGSEASAGTEGGGKGARHGVTVGLAKTEAAAGVQTHFRQRRGVSLSPSPPV